MSGARRLTSRRHTWHQQQCLDIPRAHAGCFVSRRSPRRMAAATDWVLRWDLCEAVDLRGAEAGRFQNPVFDHFLSAAATATSQVGRGYALTHTLSHTLVYARRHSKHSRIAHTQLSTGSPHLLFDAPQHCANGHAAHSLRSDEIASPDLGLLRHARATPETPSAVRSKMYNPFSTISFALLRTTSGTYVGGTEEMVVPHM